MKRKESIMLEQFDKPAIPLENHCEISESNGTANAFKFSRRDSINRSYDFMRDSSARGSVHDIITPLYRRGRNLKLGYSEYFESTLWTDSLSLSRSHNQI